jgi:metallo-beta-lactamase class B
MNRLFPLCLLFFLPVNAFAQESIRISPDLTCTRLQEDVFLITHYFPGFGSTSLFVALPGHKGVLVDTPHESTGTRALLGWIDSTFGELEMVAINTGWHQDNLGGNEYLRSSGIDIYGPDRTADLLTLRGAELKEILLESTRDLEDQRYYESYRQLELLPPNKLFPVEEGLKLEIGDEVFEVFFPGESHTVDNTVVYLDRRQILFGGCMVLAMQSQRPGFIEHANMYEWPLSIKKVIDKFPLCKIVVPGHGLPGDISLLYHTIDILDRFNAENPE